MNSSPKHSWHFSWKNKAKIHMETQKTPSSQNSIEKQEQKLYISHFLPMDYTTKLQSSKLYSTGTKRDTQINEKK